MELAPKTLLKERYEIIRKLGQGGMGAVYMAHDVVLEDVVAVKANRNPLPQSSNLFLREARLLATLRHPNLPRVTDYFIINEIQYLVMDYIPGDDLNVIIKETGVQPLDMVLLWAEQIGSALVYLHNQNPPVVHRDIKPGNIKLMPSGEVMLVDFGIAKSNDPSQATTTGMTGFTPGYAPPEQYGTAHTGTYTDQYALAATLYHLLTNQHPVDSLQRIMGTAVLTPMNLLNPKIPAPIQAAIEKAMSLHPEERFPGVEEFLKVLTNPANLKAPAISIETSPANPVASARTPTVKLIRSDLSKGTARHRPGSWVWLGEHCDRADHPWRAGGGFLYFQAIFWNATAHGDCSACSGNHNGHGTGRHAVSGGRDNLLSKRSSQPPSPRRKCSARAARSPTSATKATAKRCNSG